MIDADPETIDSNMLKIKLKYSVPKKINNEVLEISLQSQNIGFY